MTEATETNPGSLLLAEDDAVFARVVARALQRRGFDVHTASTIEEATQLLAAAQKPPDFAVLDLNLAGNSGLKLIAPIRAANPGCRILVLTGYASVATAVDAIKLGANQYLAKPADVDAIIRSLRADQPPDAESVPDDLLSVQEVEWEHIQRVLRDNNGNVSSTARSLNMHRRTLQRKLFKRPSADAGTPQREHPKRSE